MKSDRPYLEHIRDAIAAIETYTAGMIRETFMQNRLVQDGVIRELEIIGEAAKNISSDFKSAHDEVPWKDIVGMRDKPVHEYFGVDIKVVWETVQENLPALKSQIARLL